MTTDAELMVAALERIALLGDDKGAAMRATAVAVLRLTGNLPVRNDTHTLTPPQDGGRS